MDNPRPNPENWLEDHGDMMFRYALMRVGDRALAEDLVQTSLAEGIRSLSRFRGDSAESTWLVGILKHKIMDHFRTKGRQVPMDMEDASLVPLREAATQKARDMGLASQAQADPQSRAEILESMARLQDCLETLPPQLRRSFVLRELEGLSTQEICKIMDITPTNLWVNLHRSRAKLQSCLGTAEEAEGT